jgi:hypothetical protein
MNQQAQLTTTVNTNVALGDMERMAVAITKSGLFGMKTPDQALALMIVAQAENKHPGTVAAEYHIIQGRASLKSDAMLARFQNAGGKVEWHEHTNEIVSATFSHPLGGSLRIDWDMARAREAGLGGKDNWAKYPRQMLRARVISEGVRAVFPGVLQGMYTPEEVQDFSPAQTTTTRQVTLAEVKAAAPQAEDVHEVKEVTVEVVAEPVKKPRKAKVSDVASLPERSWEDALEARIFEHEGAVNKFLFAKGFIGEGQTWLEVADQRVRDRMLANTAGFLEVVLKFNDEEEAK